MTVGRCVTWVVRLPSDECTNWCLTTWGLNLDLYWLKIFLLVKRPSKNTGHYVFLTDSRLDPGPSFQVGRPFEEFPQMPDPGPMPLSTPTAPYFNPPPPVPTPMPACVPVAPDTWAPDPYRKRSASRSRFNKADQQNRRTESPTQFPCQRDSGLLF